MEQYNWGREQFGIRRTEEIRTVSDFLILWNRERSNFGQNMNQPENGILRLVDLFHGVKDHLRYSRWSQYTGLQDAKGVKIYFDDLIADEDEDLYQIIWNTTCIGAKRLKTGKIFDIRNIDTFTITGNIVDNPELLRKDNQ